MKAPRLRLLVPTREGDPRASAVAFVVQCLLIAIVVPSLLVPIAFEILRDDAGRVVTPERINYVVALPDDTERSTETPRAGGDGRPLSDEPTPPPAPIVAPNAVPSTLVPSSGEPVDPAGSGPLVGGGGPTRGIRPSFTDRRLWTAPSDVVVAPLVPMTRADTLRALLAGRTEAYLDSLAALPVERRPGDWTFERNGKKYGVDQQYIRLGDFSIPTPLLALLPMNAQANPIARERALRLDAMRSEIQTQAARMAREDEFRAAVRALRERKERERREAEAQRRTEPAEPSRP